MHFRSSGVTTAEAFVGESFHEFHDFAAIHETFSVQHNFRLTHKKHFDVEVCCTC